MARKQKSAKDFPPEFLDIWNLAVDGRLMIAMPTIGAARNMIQQLYIFRKRLTEESPQIAAPFNLVDLRMHDELGNVITAKQTAVPQKAIIRPYTPEWKGQIRQQLVEQHQFDDGTILGRVVETGGGRSGEGGLQPSQGLAAIPPEGLSPPRPLEGGFSPSQGNEEDSPDAMTTALSTLGYSTEEGEKK